MYKIVYVKNTLKDMKKIKTNKLDTKLKNLINVIKKNPLQNSPPYEKLIGDLQGAYSRRINIQHRLAYQIYETEKIVKIISIWSHYENI